MSFRLLRFADRWMGLPKKIEDSYHFRKSWRDHLKAFNDAPQPRLWIHGSSVGELEDIAAFFSDAALIKRAGFEKRSVILTASSVSAKNYLSKVAKDFFYAGPLPPEEFKECRAFVEHLQPNFMVMSHADIWPNLMKAYYKWPEQKGLLWLPDSTLRGRRFSTQVLGPGLKSIGARSKYDSDFFKSSSDFRELHIREIQSVGNPRVDRIVRRIEDSLAKERHPLENYGAAPDKSKISILLGSAWVEDAKIMASSLKCLPITQRSRLQIVVIPHEVDDSHQVATIQGLLPQARIVPVKGILVESFRNFTASFIGGGYRTGLHNVLEPALWAVPTVCGHLTENQAQASTLARQKQLHIARTAGDLAQFLLQLMNPEALKILQGFARKASDDLRQENVGAAQRLALLIARSSKMGS